MFYIDVRSTAADEPLEAVSNSNKRGVETPTRFTPDVEETRMGRSLENRQKQSMMRSLVRIELRSHCLFEPDSDSPQPRGCRM